MRRLPWSELPCRAFAGADTLRWWARDAVKNHLASTASRSSGAGVALTFDDGPWPGVTDRVLDVLEEFDARATFFCVGRNVRRHPELVHRIRAAGHAVGSHSMSHPTPLDTKLPSLRREYVDGRRALEDVLEEPVALFRPPHGQLCLGSAAVVHRAQMRTWLWSVDPQDWLPGRRPEEIVEVAAAAGPGDVVLLHDWVEQPEHPSATDRSATLAALPTILSTLRSRDLVLEALPA
jgi:peptidoglycan-N-acetylglucosamine deacetylase